MIKNEPIKVLFVDDNEGISDIVKLELEDKKKFHVTLFADPKKAMEYMQTNPVDVVVSDYLMPEVNGIEFLNVLKNGFSKNVPFILFTGIKEDVATEAINGGALYCIRKGNNATKELYYAAEDAGARKKSADSQVDILKIWQAMNSLTRHDWRNNDTSIGGYLGLIEETDDIEQIREYCKKAIFILGKNSSLREESKILQEIGVDKNEWFSLEKIILKFQEKQNKFNLNFPKKQNEIEFINEIPKDIEIFVDPAIFFNVLGILIDNSRRHGQRVTKIRFYLIKMNGLDVFVCEDNGVGIVPENKERIFDRGFGSNTGLGLFLAKQFMEMSGGDIIEIGECGKNARFAIIPPIWRHRRRLKKQ